jgi:hypothetical protein
MKIILLLVAVVSLVTGCRVAPQAPAMNRMAGAEPIDVRYLEDVFVPSIIDQATRMALTNSVSNLKEHLVELKTFMSQVESGKIAVTKAEGAWESFQKKDGYWIYAGYYGQFWTLSQFEKHKNQDPFPLVYGFRFSTNGYINYADTLEDGFDFGEQGRVKHYWLNKTPDQHEQR